jgi:hypothetical protein
MELVSLFCVPILSVAAYAARLETEDRGSGRVLQKGRG